MWRQSREHATKCNKYTSAVSTRPDPLLTSIPLIVYGDGNCLCHAISFALYGHKNLHIPLRLLCTLEIGTHIATIEEINSIMDSWKYGPLDKANKPVLFSSTIGDIIKLNTPVIRHTS